MKVEAMIFHCHTCAQVWDAERADTRCTCDLEVVTPTQLVYEVNAVQDSGGQLWTAQCTQMPLGAVPYSISPYTAIVNWVEALRTRLRRPDVCSCCGRTL